MASLFLLMISQGAALEYGIHWAFNPFKLKPKLELIYFSVAKINKRIRR